MNVLKSYVGPVLRRWPLIIAVCLVVSGISVGWAVTHSSPTWTATAVLTAQSQDRAPDQDGVLARGYVDYFNQPTYQSLLRSKRKISDDVSLAAKTGADSPILYVEATAPSADAAKAAASAAAEGFRVDVRDSLVVERTQEVKDLQTQVDGAVVELQKPGTTEAEVSVILDQVRSLQGRITDISSDATNHLKMLQEEPGVTESGSSPVVTMVAGVLGGLALGVLLAFLLALLDDRVRTASDVRRLGLEVVANVPRSADARVRRRSIEKLANSLGLVGMDRPPVFAVVTPSRSAAGSRIAHDLAVVFGKRRPGGLLVEADLRGAPTGPAGRPGLVNVLEGQASVNDAMVVDSRTGIRVLPAGNLNGRDPYTTMDPTALVVLITDVSRNYGAIVLDAGSLDEAPESQVVCASADRVIIAAERGTTRRRDLVEAQRLLRDVHASVVGLVLDAAVASGEPAAPQRAEWPANMNVPTVRVAISPPRDGVADGRGAVVGGGPNGSNGAVNGHPRPPAPASVGGTGRLAPEDNPVKDGK